MNYECCIEYSFSERTQIGLLTVSLVSRKLFSVYNAVTTSQKQSPSSQEASQHRYTPPDNSVLSESRLIS